MMTALAAVSLLFAAIPAYFYFRNVGVFRTLAPALGPNAGGEAAISVLIPARDEAENIADCIASALSGGDEHAEVVVLDDHSTDGTGAIVAGTAERDPRVRLITGATLPTGWNGKQHACWQLAGEARNERLLFLDADVRLEPGALRRIVQRMGGGGEGARVDLLSGFPRQLTGSLVEQMLIPLIHFVLLGFLSLRHLRRAQLPEFAAGCGQLFVTTRSAYLASGGHAAIRASRHDGLKLPRVYLENGLSVDVFDATDLASVRMYRGAGATWRGLSKNADEGIACPRLIVPVTALLACGQVAPMGLFVACLTAPSPAAAEALSGAALLLSYLPRLDAVRRFREPFFAALLHPASVLLFLAIQWWSLVASLTGRQVAWKGRPAASSP
ncbi:MAG: glycosyltransferase family 2 protein [Planctomycetota bacterium]